MFEELFSEHLSFQKQLGGFSPPKSNLGERNLRGGKKSSWGKEIFVGERNQRFLSPRFDVFFPSISPHVSFSNSLHISLSLYAPAPSWKEKCFCFFGTKKQLGGLKTSQSLFCESLKLKKGRKTGRRRMFSGERALERNMWRDMWRDIRRDRAGKIIFSEEQKRKSKKLKKKTYGELEK